MATRARDERGDGTEHVDCALCNEDVSRPMFKGRDWRYGGERTYTVVQCTRCELIYLNPRPDSEARAASYAVNDYVPHRPSSSENGLLGHSRRKIRDLVLRLAYGYHHETGALDSRQGLPWGWGLMRSPPWTRGGRLLDVGCGNGEYLFAMREMGWHVMGVEPSASACESMKRRLDIPAYCGTLEDAGWNAGSFDVVTLWHVLEHCSEPLTVLSEIHRLLRPGGLLMGEVPNASGWGARVFGDRWFHWDVPRHLYAFAPSTLGRMLAAAGFSTYRLLPVLDVKGWAGSLQYRRLSPGKGAYIDRIRWRRSVNAILWPLAIFASLAGGAECTRFVARLESG